MFKTESKRTEKAPTIGGYLWRVDRYGQRYYTDGSIIYPSVTTLIKKVVPASPHLIDWQVEKGKEEAQRISSEKADYGTVFHVLAQRLLLGESIAMDTDTLAGIALASQLGTTRTRDIEEVERLRWAESLQLDLMALAQWVHDYDVQPLAFHVDGEEVPCIEMAVAYSDGDVQYAGTIDLVCTMNAKKYTDKTPIEKRNRVNAIVDFKTGSIWETYDLQLEMYKKALAQMLHNAGLIEHHDEVRDCKLYNWQPSKWRGETATYKLTDQTDKVSYVDKLLDYYASKYGAMTLPTKRVFDGSLSLTDGNTARFRDVDQHEQIAEAIGMTAEELTEYNKGR